MWIYSARTAAPSTLRCRDAPGLQIRMQYELLCYTHQVHSAAGDRAVSLQNLLGVGRACRTSEFSAEFVGPAGSDVERSCTLPNRVHAILTVGPPSIIGQCVSLGPSEMSGGIFFVCVLGLSCSVTRRTQGDAWTGQTRPLPMTSLSSDALPLLCACSHASCRYGACDEILLRNTPS
jgi:hypothetical protein